MKKKDHSDDSHSPYSWKRNLHRNSKPMSLDNLIEFILELERKGVISFQEFKILNYQEIHSTYLGMVTPKQLIKAIIKIEDLKHGRVEGSSLTTEIRTYKHGAIKIERKTEFF